MKKIVIALFIIGMFLMPLDVNNMLVFILSKILGILFIVPACLVYGE